MLAQTSSLVILHVFHARCIQSEKGVVHKVCGNKELQVHESLSRLPDMCVKV